MSGAMVKLLPSHAVVLRRAVEVMADDARRIGVRSWVGLAELKQLADALDEGAMVAVPASELPAVDTTRHRSPLVALGESSAESAAVAPRWLDRADAAALMGISVRTLDRRVAEGVIRCRRVGALVRFTIEDLLEDVRQCTH